MRARSGPMPPPVRKPATPTPGAEPTSGASPCGAAASITCGQTTPAPMRAVPARRRPRPVEAAGVDEQDVVAVGGDRAVAGALDRDAQPVVVGEAHGLRRRRGRRRRRRPRAGSGRRRRSRAGERRSRARPGGRARRAAAGRGSVSASVGVVIDMVVSVGRGFGDGEHCAAARLARAWERLEAGRQRGASAASQRASVGRAPVAAPASRAASSSGARGRRVAEQRVQAPGDEVHRRDDAVVADRREVAGKRRQQLQQPRRVLARGPRRRRRRRPARGARATTRPTGRGRPATRRSAPRRASWSPRAAATAAPQACGCGLSERSISAILPSSRSSIPNAKIAVPR